MIAIFEDSFLKEHIAMRGGTALHKIHLASPAPLFGGHRPRRHHRSRRKAPRRGLEARAAPGPRRARRYLF
jgi:hypothetical protein